jgi:uncharacterized protein
VPAEKIHVEVAYALPDRQKLLTLQVPVGTTAREAVRLSAIADEFPGINLDEDILGVFGQALGVRGMPPPEEYQLQQGDRVEIYRPLTADPKEVRKKRAREAEQRRQEKSSSGAAADEGA